MPPKPKKQEPWRNRIVGRGVVAARSIKLNERNWKTHPPPQQQALAAVLDEVGWVQDVVEAFSRFMVVILTSGLALLSPDGVAQ